MNTSVDVFKLLDDGEIRINDRPLLDIVADAEHEHVLAERKLRIANGTPADEANSFISDYQYLRPTPQFRRNLWDTPEPTAANGFVIDDADPTRDMATLLGCTCGIIDCWFLLATITITPKQITWANFRQFHKDWEYELEFRFDHDQYLGELNL